MTFEVLGDIEITHACGHKAMIWGGQREAQAARSNVCWDCWENRVLEGFPLPELRAQLKALGVTSVITFGGPRPVDEWTPYGNGIERTWRGVLCSHPTTHVVEIHDVFNPRFLGDKLGAFVLGVWPTERSTDVH